jgi:hypothetical protein
VPVHLENPSTERRSTGHYIMTEFCCCLSHPFVSFMAIDRPNRPRQSLIAAQLLKQSLSKMTRKQIHFSIPKSKVNRAFRAVINRCDICDDRIDCAAAVDMLEELDNSYEYACDERTYHDGPKLMLCTYCQYGYSIPNWTTFLFKDSEYQLL